MNGNAQIKDTMLGYEDHGIMTCFLHLEQKASGQGFGGFCLDDVPLKEDKKGDRRPSKLAGWWIKRILETVGVERWEDLKGQFIRVDGEEFGDIFGIGHIIEDKWFYPKKELEAMKEKGGLDEDL